MANLRTLSSKERKKVLEQLEKQYGCDTKFLKQYVFLFQEKRKRYFIVNEDVLELDLEKLPVDSLGLYLCGLMGNGELRLSIEGSQLLGPKSKKNILEIDEKEFFDWIRGVDIEKETEREGFVIIKHKKDFCGAGKPVLNEKTGTTVIHNYVPKTRYVRSKD
ncbi:hypothetical protein GOV07_04715 [Candidatus Woesearchaeota archaeon]|nr:hypothetical protein [Candidatus Woesearchaeota archaeon]